MSDRRARRRHRRHQPQLRPLPRRGARERLRADPPDVNVVVVDDGSTDDSREVLRGFEDRVEVVLKEKGGQASALNAGIERCRGDVVLFLDADDGCGPQAAARVAAAFAADPRLSKVQFRMAVDRRRRAGRPGTIKPGGTCSAPAGDMRAGRARLPLRPPLAAGRRHRLPHRGGAPDPADPRRPTTRAAAPTGTWSTSPPCSARRPLLDEVCAEYRVHGGNAYELERAELDLDHVRDSDRLRRGDHPRSLRGSPTSWGWSAREPILSISDLANRLVSLRLEPGAHPIAGRPAAGACSPTRSAPRAAASTSRWPMKALFVAWFALMAVAPRGAGAAARPSCSSSPSGAVAQPALGRLQRVGRCQARDCGAEMRILIATDHYPPFIGGAHRQAQLLAAGMAERGHEVAVVTPWHGGLPSSSMRTSRHRPPGAPAADGDARRWSATPSSATSRPSPTRSRSLGLRRLIADFEPDVIHAYGWLAFSVAAALGRQADPAADLGPRLRLLLRHPDAAAQGRALLGAGAASSAPPAPATTTARPKGLARHRRRLRSAGRCWRAR